MMKKLFCGLANYLCKLSFFFLKSKITSDITSYNKNEKIGKGGNIDLTSNK